MAITNGTLNVTTSPVLVPTTGTDSRAVTYEVLVDNSSAAEVVAGNASVTTANGFRIAAGASQRFVVNGDDPLYLIAGSAVTVRYLISRVIA